MIFVFDTAKQRLDKFLTEKIPDLSRSQIQKMIKNGQVLVNDKLVSVHNFLKKGDEIKILKNIKEIKDIKGIANVSSRQTIRGLTSATPIPEIIYQDDNILVINKPPGLLVHARQESKKGSEPTLVDWLIKKYPQIKKVGDAPEWRPGLVHRLDKETSGVMVIAKTPAAYLSLKKQFHDHLVKKEYLALVYGKITNDTGIIDLPIGRATAGGKMAARSKNVIAIRQLAEKQSRSKNALTEFEVIKRFPNSTLVQAYPKTGRTHQIRVHFFALGHSLVGDPLYQLKKNKEIKTPRLLLHAHKLTLVNLDGEEKTFEAKIPEEFKKYS